MSETAGTIRLRAMTTGDVPAVLAVQEPGAVVGLSEVFPQDVYPFPRERVARRWREEIATDDVDCFVVVGGDVVVGFAAIRGDEFLHFGIAVERWGDGTARRAHDEVLYLLRSRGVDRAWLRVFTGNARGRRFYESLGWRRTGSTSRSSFPPHAELLRYERALQSPQGFELGHITN